MATGKALASKNDLKRQIGKRKLRDLTIAFVTQSFNAMSNNQSAFGLTCNHSHTPNVKTFHSASVLSSTKISRVACPSIAIAADEPTSN